MFFLLRVGKLGRLCFYLTNIYIVHVYLLIYLEVSVNIRSFMFHAVECDVDLSSTFSINLHSHFLPLQNPVKRVKGVELIEPVAYGTISFWLGKKAEEYEIDPFPLIYMSL
jgi:hypothetical protein